MRTGEMMLGSAPYWCWFFVPAPIRTIKGEFFALFRASAPKQNKAGDVGLKVASHGLQETHQKGRGR